MGFSLSPKKKNLTRMKENLTTMKGFKVKANKEKTAEIKRIKRGL